MLTAEEIALIQKLLAEKTILQPSIEFPYRISRRCHGYSDDPKIGRLQAKLSIMAGVISEREGGKDNE